MEGQSIGIIPPGTDAAGKPHRLRLYSIASPRGGDAGDDKTIGLCIKRTIYTDEAGNEVRGVCSNYTNDLVPGAKVKICGPIGKHFLMPADPKTPMLMIATGTGIAPFRGFLRQRARLAKAERGPAFLVMGVRHTSALLYDQELRTLMADDGCAYLTAISAEQKNAAGGRMYVGDRLPELEDVLWPLLAERNIMVYQCGLKGMEKGVEASLAAIAERHGWDWAELRTALVAEKRWLVDTY
jgi:ferredoxin--NADP+ reductase